MKYNNDLLDKRFGRLQVIENIKNKYNRESSTWKCKCDCGNTKTVRASHLIKSMVKSCGCLYNETRSESGKKNRRGTRNITGRYWNDINEGARKRNIEVSITIEYAQDLLEKQNFLCALSGIKLIMNIENTFDITGRRDLNTGSLDRIDPMKGYIDGNVQWVYKHINKMKMDLQQEEFLYFCEKISNHYEKINKDTIIGNE